MNPIGPARILVPTDFSESALPALEYGVTLARAFGAHLSVLHVVPHVDRRARPWTRESGFAVRLANASMCVDERELRDRDHSDLIVMGSHGQTAAPVSLGRVAERVQRVACPFLTIPSWTRHLHDVDVIWPVQPTSVWAS